ncbi:MAG: DMT family transporter [Eubacteriaceae bacterium]
MKTLTLNFKAILLATISCILWGSAFSVVKLGYSFFGISNGTAIIRILFAAYRFTLAGLLILFVALLMKLSFRPVIKYWKTIGLIGIAQTFFQYVFFYIGLANTEAVKSSILTGTGVFFSMILAHFYFKDDTMTKRKAIGAIIGFLGILVANLTGESLNLTFALTGEGFIIFATIVGAIANIFVRVVTRDVHPVIVAGVQMTFGGVLLFIFGLIGASPLDMTYTPQGIGVLIYLAFLSATAFSIWFYLLSHYNVSAVSIHKFQIPMWGTLISVVLLGETLTISKIIALIMVVVGILVVNHNGFSWKNK